MSRDEVKQRLQQNIAKELRVTFEGGDVQIMTVINLDGEGFVNEVDGEYFWATYDDVEDIECLS